METAGLVVGVVGVIPACIQFNDYIRRLSHDIKHSKEQKLYKKAEILYNLQAIELHRPAVEKLDGEQQDALGAKITGLRGAVEELERALKGLDREHAKVIASAIWAFRAKMKIQGLLERITKERNDLALQLILIGSFFNFPEKNTPSDTERIVRFITASMGRRKNATSFELQPQDLDTSGLVPIAGSDLRYKLAQTRLAFLVVEETAVVGVDDLARTRARVSEIAAVFHGATLEDRAFQTQVAHIGQCVGYMAAPGTGRVQLVYEVPIRGGATWDDGDKVPPPPELTSLRALLRRRKSHTLNARLGLARALATAVFYTHAYRYVHKDVRPANVLLEIGSGGGDDAAFCRATLAGFGDARAEDGSSLRKSGPASLDDVTLYQHPSRIAALGGRLPEAHTLLHDVYSLGVCLLELGLWTSFVDDDRHAAMRAAPPVARQSRLYDLAEKYLPREIGYRYARVVQKCLRGCDLGRFDEEGDITGDDVAMGSRYCEVVLEELDRIEI